MYVALLCITLCTILLQGGFFPTVYLIAALIMSVIGFFSKKHALNTSEVLLIAIFTMYCISSLVNGYDSTSMAQACLPGACFVFLYLYKSLSPQEKGKFIDGLIVSSGVIALLSVLAFCGVLHLTGAVTARRLQSTFQYANAAGSWFAAVILLGQERKSKAVKMAVIPCISALLLTRSVGAFGVYTIAQLVRLFVRRKEKRLWHELFTTHGIAAAFSVMFFIFNTWAAVALLLVLVLLCFYIDNVLALAEKCYFHWICMALGTVGIIFFLLSQRVSTSLLTFVERLSQIRDGSMLLFKHPVFGVGPGNWENIYPYYQSEQYTSTVIHSSIIQIGVDAGFPAVVMTICFVALAFQKKGRPFESSLAAALLIGHSLFDFTMKFFPLCVLTIATLFETPEESSFVQPSKQKSIAACSIALCVLFSFSIFTELQAKRLIRYSQVGDWKAVINQYEQQQLLLGKSPAVSSLYYSALYYTGKREQIVEDTESSTYGNTSILLLRADALKSLGRQDEACELLLHELKLQKYRILLFEQVSNRLTEWHVESRYLDEYDKIVDVANASQTVLGRLQGDQVDIKHINRGGVS